MSLDVMQAGMAAPVRLPADIPVELGRDEARELARRELTDPSYNADPPLVQQAVEWIIERIQDLISRTAGVLSGSVALRLLIVALGLVIAVVLVRMGPLARRGTRSDPLFPAERRAAAEYRAAAEAAAGRQDWSTAVIERYRAVVVGFEERGLLDPRPGRTADEAAAEAGVVLPGLVHDLTRGSIMFDGVRYGGHTATPADDALMRRLDAEASVARPGPAESGFAPAVPAVPR